MDAWLRTLLRTLVASLLAMGTTSVVAGYTYDASDFATEVVEYVKGADVGSHWITGASYDNAQAALGRPTVDTSGDGWFIPLDDRVPTVPVNPPSRAYEIVTVGNGGSLTVKFDHAVLDDPANPYGIDFLIFSNAFMLGENWASWENGDPAAFTTGDTSLFALADVSVSQDGVTWHDFTDGPYAGDGPATLGREYDTLNPDNSLGSWNLWWGAPTDPTLPLDPSLTLDNLAGKTVAEIANLYGESAGGTGFDIGTLGLDWIRYIRVTDIDNVSATTEIDAFADVAPAPTTQVPEPASWTLALAGLAALAARRRRRAT
jgi:MYXO-CTERM domain-containing protein